MNFRQDQQEMIDEMFQRAGVTPDKEEDIIVTMFAIAPAKAVDEFEEDFVNHLQEGEDHTENSNAVGGFNQNELILLTSFLEYAETL